MAVVGMLVGTMPVAAAATVEPSVEEQVAALNAEAVEKFQAKEYQEAVSLLEQAYELQPEPNYLFNIARIHEESGNLDEAVELYERFVKEPGVALDARERGLERLRVLRAIIEETERTAEPEPVIEPEPEPVVEPEPEPRAKGKPSKVRVAGYALLGTGGAVLATGGVMAGLALQRANVLEGQHTLEERRDTSDQGRTMALTADILFGVGGAMAAAGLVMVLVSLERKPAGSGANADAGPTARRPRLSPWANRHEAGMAATLRF